MLIETDGWWLTASHLEERCYSLKWFEELYQSTSKR